MLISWTFCYWKKADRIQNAPSKKHLFNNLPYKNIQKDHRKMAVLKRLPIPTHMGSTFYKPNCVGVGWCASTTLPSGYVPCWHFSPQNTHPPHPSCQKLGPPPQTTRPPITKCLTHRAKHISMYSRGKPYGKYSLMTAAKGSCCTVFFYCLM